MKLSTWYMSSAEQIKSNVIDAEHIAPHSSKTTTNKQRIRVVERNARGKKDKIEK